MHKTVISDTSCLIVLSNINEISLLKESYEEVYTTPEIESEFGRTLPEWIRIKSPSDKSQQIEKDRFLPD